MFIERDNENSRILEQELKKLLSTKPPGYTLTREEIEETHERVLAGHGMTLELTRGEVSFLTRLLFEHYAALDNAKEEGKGALALMKRLGFDPYRERTEVTCSTAAPRA